MENNKIVKVYSNNSKSARLKRRKNKFQRIWDPEKQTYVKVRKAKFKLYPKKEEKKIEDINKKMAALKRRKGTKKSVPVTVKTQKPVSKQNKSKEPARVHAKVTSINVQKPKIYKIHGVNLTWDEKELRYKRAA